MAGMEKMEFARHLLSFTVDSNYVLAAAGVQAERPLLHFMLSSRQQTESLFYYRSKIEKAVMCSHEFFRSLYESNVLTFLRNKLKSPLDSLTQNIYIQFTINPAVVALREKEAFMD